MQNLGGSTPWRLVFWNSGAVSPAGTHCCLWDPCLLCSTRSAFCAPSASLTGHSVRTKLQLPNSSVAWYIPLAQASTLYHRVLSFEDSPASAPARPSTVHVDSTVLRGRLLRAGHVQLPCGAPWSSGLHTHRTPTPPAPSPFGLLCR